MFATLAAFTPSTPFAFTDGIAVTRVTPSIELSGAESDFQVKIAYAYVGSLPLDKASYIDSKTNETMVHISEYPSAVFLNFTAAPSAISSCDAVIAAYGVKIVADTGPTEYYGWTVGTNYTAFTQENLATIYSYRSDMIHQSIYRFRGGSWSYSLADRSILSHTIGSVGSYRTNGTFTSRAVLIYQVQDYQTQSQLKSTELDTLL